MKRVVFTRDGAGIAGTGGVCLFPVSSLARWLMRVLPVSLVVVLRKGVGVMDMTDKSAQPSMEEILASIRKLLSEEGEPREQEIDFNARPIMLGDEDEEESSEFDLPAIFRSSSSAPERAKGERTTASLVRLTDAIRSVAGGMAAYDADAVPLHPIEEAQRGLSSLKSEETVAAQAEPVRELRTAAAGHFGGALGDDSFFEEVPEPARREIAAPAEPARVTASSEPRDVQRVMAPFKDTKFKALSSPQTALPSPPEARPLPAPQPQPQPVTVAAQPKAFEPRDPSLGHRREPVLPSAPVRKDVKQGLSVSFPQAAIAHREAAPQSDGIEEAAADLLRPMLRSWLAENMPKMVEKALVLEMQQQLGTAKKSGGSEG